VEITRSRIVHNSAALSFSGAFTIPELHERSEFSQITGAGYHECQANDVLVRA
jgi:hypothetical protein